MALSKKETTDLLATELKKTELCKDLNPIAVTIAVTHVVERLTMCGFDLHRRPPAQWYIAEP